jgi:hypothetical protein
MLTQQISDYPNALVQEMPGLYDIGVWGNILVAKVDGNGLAINATTRDIYMVEIAVRQYVSYCLNCPHCIHPDTSAFSLLFHFSFRTILRHSDKFPRFGSESGVRVD